MDTGPFLGRHGPPAFLLNVDSAVTNKNTADPDDKHRHSSSPRRQGQAEYKYEYIRTRILRSIAIGISASWPTSMPGRRPRPSASSTTPARATRSAKSMMAPPRWTGWSRSRSAASRSRPPRRPASGTHGNATIRVPHQHHRHAGPRRLHGRSRALAARARRRRHAARFRRRRRAADRDGVAPGRPLRRAAPHLLEQDGPRRRRLRSLPAT